MSTPSDADVLLVEDDEMAADLIDAMLAMIGYRRVRRAATVEEALKEIQIAKPAFVVLDASLRGAPAHTVAAQLIDEKVPFVVSTGYDPKKLPRPFHEGIPLKKPYDRFALQAAIDAAHIRITLL